MTMRALFTPSKLIPAAVLLLILSAPMLTMGGCSVWDSRPRLRKQKIDMNVSTQGVPPIKVETLDDHYMLIMQAPNSGWSIAIDKDERIAFGMRLFVTVRRPDPAFMYPQAIVDKRMLSTVRTDSSLEVYVRLLDADEKTKGRGYGKLTPVDQFEE